MDIAGLYNLAARIVPHIPPRVGYRSCDLLGALLGPRLPVWPQILANLLVTMPDATGRERDAAARRLMIGLFKNYFDLFRFPSLTSTALARTTIAHGVEHARRALEQGRGLIVVAPHCGNYTIGMLPMAQYVNTRLLLVVEQMVDPQVHQIINRMRQVPGIDVEPLNPTISRSILRALRRNQVVVLAGDRDIAENNLVVDFFGRPTPLPNGPATLALRTGAPVITCFASRLPNNRTVVHIDPPLVIERSASLQQDIRDVTQKIAYHMQAYIRHDPSQWLVTESVWPTA